MLLSTNLPYGHDAIAEHLASGQSLTMNVLREADVNFIRELGGSDPQRYARLQKNMLRIGAGKAGWIVGTCARCQGRIHNAPFVSAVEPGEFCSRVCRDERADRKTAHRKRHFTECLACGRKFLAKRSNNTTCSPRCRQRACRSPKNSELPDMSQIPEIAPASPLKMPELQA